jgi:large subunit ribosomal protein L17
MRHNKKFNHLGRKSAHRKALLANMASSLILHKRITTTVAKAKALKMYVEPLITKSKQDTTHSRRVVFSYIQDKEAVSELFREVSPKIMDRPGGYTRILKTGNRLGDNAEMCIIELVDYNENMLETKETKKSSSRRRRGGSKSKSTAVSPDANAQGKPKVENTAVEDTKKEEVEEPKVDETKAEVSEEKAENTDEKKEDKE